MAEDINSRLSGEDIRRFEQSLAKFDAGLARQEEIAKKLLDMEKELGAIRLAFLDQYLDAFSKRLDDVVARKTSMLDDTFLIMERKALENYKKNISGSGDSQQTQSNGNGGGGQKPPSNGSSNSGSDNDGTKITDAQKKALGEAEPHTAENIAARLRTFTAQYKTAKEQSEAIIKGEKDAVITIEQLREAYRDKRKKDDEAYRQKETELENTLTALTMARLQATKENKDQIRAVEMRQQQELWSAELAAQEQINAINAERKFAGSPEGRQLQAQKAQAEATQKSIEQLEAQRIKYIANEERKLKLKNHRELTEQEYQEIVDRANLEYELSQENIEKLKKQQKEDAEKLAKLEEINDDKKKREKDLADKRAIDSQIAEAVSATGFDKYNNVIERFMSLQEVVNKADSQGMSKGLASLTVAVKALSSITQQLESKMDEIASFKGPIDTRLQGSSNEKWAGSYWDQLVHDMTSVGAVNPFFKQETFANKIKELVDSGIAFDLEQRAFLATISDKIATTFEVADATLLRLIRIQQEDSTAGRMGMEAALNAFLNNMYETTEYLNDIAGSVRGSLAEMESLMGGAAATEVEFQVQKWLGSLYSVGMSQDAVNSISQALGQIAAGQIEGLTNGGAGNLLIMAANDAGLSIADILTEGINSSDTNKLLQAVVNYLAEIADSSKDNNVVQQQLANVFGVKASDLRAATNLSTQDSVSAIYGNSMSYGNMLNKLFTMAGSMGSRTSLGEMMTNVWDNGQYTLAGSMASNPISYFIFKAASLLDDATGGIGIPSLTVMMNGVDLEASVADLMRVASMSTGILGSIGAVVQGLTNSFNGQSMLTQLGIKSGSGLAVTPRGSGVGASAGGGSSSTSSSGYVGNASGSDVKDATMQEANDTKKQLMVEAQEEAEANQIDSLNTTVLKIYELLDDVAHGNSYFRVKVEGYGLTKASGNSALGGVSALENLGSSSSGSSVSSGSSSGSSLSDGGVNSNSLGSSVSLGGWTATI